MNRPAASALLLLAAAAAAACGPSTPSGAGSGSAAPPRSYKVSVLTVEPRSLEYAVEAVGTLEAYDVVTVPARVPGILESLAFDEGDSVTAEQVLAVVDGKRYSLELEQGSAAAARVEAAVESARARTGQAEAALKEAETALARRRGLREKNPGWVSEDEISGLDASAARTRAALAEAVAGEKVAAAQVDEARTAVSLARKNAEDARIRPPLAGVIERKHVAPGQYVKAGDPIATIVDVSRLRVRFRVSEAESVLFRQGQPVEVRVSAYPGRAFAAAVIHVNATADPVTRMVECLAAMKDPEKGLRPGFFAGVRAVLSEQAKALVVPVAAVLPSEKGFTAFVIQDGKARERALQLGLHTRDDGVEVISGLSRGDALVVEGATSLQEGVPVEIVPPSQAPGAPDPAPGGRGRE